MKAIILATVFIVIYPFSSRADTVDNYQIYIKKVLVINDGGFGSYKKGTIAYKLNRKNYRDTFDINFNHCSPDASKRRIQLQDNKGKVILEWNFSDKNIEPIMQIPISQIQDNLVSKLRLVLFYFDDMLPEGRFLTTVELREYNSVSRSRGKHYR